MTETTIKTLKGDRKKTRKNKRKNEKKKKQEIFADRSGSERESESSNLILSGRKFNSGRLRLVCLPKS